MDGGVLEMETSGSATATGVGLFLRPQTASSPAGSTGAPFSYCFFLFHILILSPLILGSAIQYSY